LKFLEGNHFSFYRWYNVEMLDFSKILLVPKFKLTWQNLYNIVASQDKILETSLGAKAYFPLTSNCEKLQWEKETFEL